MNLFHHASPTSSLPSQVCRLIPGLLAAIDRGNAPDPSVRTPPGLIRSGSTLLPGQASFSAHLLRACAGGSGGTCSNGRGSFTARCATTMRGDLTFHQAQSPSGSGKGRRAELRGELITWHGRSWREGSVPSVILRWLDYEGKSVILRCIYRIFSALPPL
jgi:hypothetical protein